MCLPTVCSPLAGGTVGKENWDVKQYYCTKMSEASFPALGGKSMFPPSTEAFVVVEYDNNFGRWTSTVDFYKQEGNSFKTSLPAKKTKEDKELPGYAGDPLHDAKFTSSSGGQKRFGTYSEKGLKFFSGLQKILKSNAKTNAVDIAAFETKFLAKLKVADAIGEDGLPTNKKDGSKKRKCPGDGPKKRQKVIISTDSDDEGELSTASRDDDDDDDTVGNESGNDSDTFDGAFGK